MVNIRLVTVGSKMPEWVASGYHDYRKRLCSDVRLNLVEIPLLKRTKSCDIAGIQKKEAGKMLGVIEKYDVVIALDVQGKSKSTDDLVEKMESWRYEGRNVSFLVGGPEGLHISCLQRADDLWSLSKLTLPHQLVKVLVVEQVYRAWSILHHIPYHK